jgi:hypothetical protein
MPECFGVSENFSHFQFGTLSEVTITVLVNTGQYRLLIKLNTSDSTSIFSINVILVHNAKISYNFMWKHAFGIEF